MASEEEKFPDPEFSCRFVLPPFVNIFFFFFFFFKLAKGGEQALILSFLFIEKLCEIFEKRKKNQFLFYFCNYFKAASKEQAA